MVVEGKQLVLWWSSLVAVLAEHELPYHQVPQGVVPKLVPSMTGWFA